MIYIFHIIYTVIRLFNQVNIVGSKLYLITDIILLESWDSLTFSIKYSDKNTNNSIKKYRNPVIFFWKEHAKSCAQIWKNIFFYKSDFYLVRGSNSKKVQNLKKKLITLLAKNMFHVMKQVVFTFFFIFRSAKNFEITQYYCFHYPEQIHYKVAFFNAFPID